MNVARVENLAVTLAELITVPPDVVTRETGHGFLCMELVIRVVICL